MIVYHNKNDARTIPLKKQKVGCRREYILLYFSLLFIHVGFFKSVHKNFYWFFVENNNGKNSKLFESKFFSLLTLNRNVNRVLD